MEKKEKKENIEKKYFTYILRCADGTLYTGYTTDPERRVKAHNSGKGARYTRSRLPVSLVYLETHETKHDAMSREALIKQLSHQEKEALIRQLPQQGNSVDLAFLHIIR